MRCRKSNLQHISSSEFWEMPPACRWPEFATVYLARQSGSFKGPSGTMKREEPKKCQGIARPAGEQHWPHWQSPSSPSLGRYLPQGSDPQGLGQLTEDFLHFLLSLPSLPPSQIPSFLSFLSSFSLPCLLFSLLPFLSLPIIMNTVLKFSPESSLCLLLFVSGLNALYYWATPSAPENTFDGMKLCLWKECPF